MDPKMLEAVADLQSYLDYLKRMGIEGLPISGPPEPATRTGIGDALVPAPPAPTDRRVPAVGARECGRPSTLEDKAAGNAALL